MTAILIISLIVLLAPAVLACSPSFRRFLDRHRDEEPGDPW